MILFIADEHMKEHAGKVIYEQIASRYPNMEFHENDWSAFTKYDMACECELLILHMVAGTCEQPFPDEAACNAVKRYCQSGGNMLLLHASCAALWHCDWWRAITGFRWVRPEDPDGAVPSTHPVGYNHVKVCKARHELVNKLKDMPLEHDEIFIKMEQTLPSMILMDTHIDEGTFPQSWENRTPWDGLNIGFLPGHYKEATTNSVFLENVMTLIDYLLQHRQNSLKLE